jgi:membrane fusion protein, multidrug efflux system
LPATIEARYESTLGFRVPGRIVRRYYDVGAVVKQGDILANLDPTDQQNQLRAAQGDLAKVQAQLINARPTPDASKSCSTVAWAPKPSSTPHKPTSKPRRPSMQQASAAVNQAKTNSATATCALTMTP